METQPRAPLSRLSRLAVACALAGIGAGADARNDDPVQTVLAFYRHINNQECGLAVQLAEGYPTAKCLKVKQLTVNSASALVQGQEKAMVQVDVRVTYKSGGIEESCAGTLPLNRRHGEWAIDFSARAFTCAFSNAASAPQMEPKREPSPPSTPPPVASAPPQAPGEPLLQPAPPGPPSAAPIAPAQSARPVPAAAATLLQTWPSEELRGQPGDERIIKLRPPDHSPPQFPVPRERLPELPAAQRDSIRHVRLPEGKKLVALTFDLCEQADDRTGYDRAIVNFLRERQVPATFYAGGKWLRSHEDKAQQLMADPLFEIGNHGWTHGNLRVLKGQRMRDQMVWTQAEYGRVWDNLRLRAARFGLESAMAGIPRQPLTLRFPYGTCSAESLQAANELGLSAIQWDVVSGDAAPGQSPQAMAGRIVGAVRPGSVVVFHANGRGSGTAAALPRIVEDLAARGFGFVTVSRLLREGTPEAVKECYELRPGDNRRYDALFGEGTE